METLVVAMCNDAPMLSPQRRMHGCRMYQMSIIEQCVRWEATCTKAIVVRHLAVSPSRDNVDGQRTHPADGSPHLRKIKRIQPQGSSRQIGPVDPPAIDPSFAAGRLLGAAYLIATNQIPTRPRKNAIRPNARLTASMKNDNNGKGPKTTSQ